MISKGKKTAGRPREFEIASALDNAIQVFWAKGYDGASLTDLTEVMGITRPSLYAAFGDKRQLFLAAIKRYATNQHCPPLVEFDAQPDIEKAVFAFFNASVDYATGKCTDRPNESNTQLGCFLGNCVSTNACEVEGVQVLLKSAIEETDKRIAKRFDHEKELANLPEDFPSLTRSRLMFDIRQGISLRARAGIGQSTIKRNLRCLVETVLS